MKNNYIILNNKKSSEIKGLIIEELPSITKAQKRVEYTTIDGLDGDVIEELGYSSYTKEMKIGLNMSANIDEIINYFDDAGTVIFSNELDKIYNVIIDEKIDFERLVKFRKATVKFHVQPFKYLVEENPVIVDIDEQTEIEVLNKGYIISKPIITLYGTGLIEIMLNGKSVFSINIDDEYVIVDSLEQEAYKDGILKNRNMSGQFPILNPGTNIIKWTGKLSKIKIEPKSRWL